MYPFYRPNSLSFFLHSELPWCFSYVVLKLRYALIGFIAGLIGVSQCRFRFSLDSFACIWHNMLGFRSKLRLCSHLRRARVRVGYAAWQWCFYLGMLSDPRSSNENPSERRCVKTETTNGQMKSTFSRVSAADGFLMEVEVEVEVRRLAGCWVIQCSSSCLMLEQSLLSIGSWFEC